MELPLKAITSVKICHLSSVHNWFDERIFQKEAKSLLKVGYDVTFIVQHDKRRIKDGVKIIPLPKPKNRLERFVFTDLRVLRLALNENASIYHFHDPELIPVGLVLKVLGKKVIYDVHEDYQQFFLARDWLSPFLKNVFAHSWWIFEKSSSFFFDHIIAVAKNWSEKFPEKNVTVVSNAPPLNFLRTLPEKQSGDAFKVVYVGTLDIFRGIDVAIEALSYLESANVELHIMGALKNESQANIFTNHPKIRYHGRVPWHELRSALENADVGLLLLRPDALNLNTTGEGNTKLFEYMSAGLPVLYSDFPKMKAFIGALGAGMPVDPTDPRRIAEQIEFLMQNEELRKKMGENGIAAVRNRHNWEAQERKLLKVYEKVLARHSR